MSSNPVLHAFFLGRAFAEVLNEKLEETLTNVLSDLGKFDAEQRENLRQFIEEVQIRAEKAAANTTATASGEDSSEDLQETIDQLRADIASVRAELKNFRTQTN